MMTNSNPSPDVPLIELRGITRVFGRGEGAVRALFGIDLSVPKNEFIAVMGSSGSGKSTCMNIIGCLDRPTSGSYHFDGVDVGGLDRNRQSLLRRHAIGFVFQVFNLLARTTALENVELPLIYQRVGRKERKERARKTLELVGLSDRVTHVPSELSGGQQQRVAIARAIVTRPLVVVADEPTGNLDSKTSLEVMNLLRHLNSEQGITIVMVTHERDMAEHAGRIVEFRDGEIIADTRKEG